MTEQEWLASTDPQAMLHYLEMGGPARDTGMTLLSYPIRFPSRHPRATDRKLRLLACGFCYLRGCAASLGYEDERVAVLSTSFGSKTWSDYAHEELDILSLVKEDMLSQAAALIRCIIGNPWRSVVLPGWRTRFGEEIIYHDCLWLTPTVLAIAHTIYDNRDFAALPLLADALEEAGCDHAGILAHLRGPCPHARGCHVLDLLLGKE